MQGCFLQPACGGFHLVSAYHYILLFVPTFCQDFTLKKREARKMEDCSRQGKERTNKLKDFEAVV